MKNKMLLIGKISFVVFFSFIIAGCATIVGQGKAELVNIRSTPEQATIVITDESGEKIFEGKTPTNVTLEKKQGYFKGKSYSVKISKEGYAEKTVAIDTRANGWYIGGNLLFGGLIGWLIVDPATGAMWTLSTDKLNVSLDALNATTSLNPDNNGIVLLENVPESLRGQMVKVTK